jgi:hypothetical protein
VILLIFAAVSAPAWFARDKDGFATPTIDADTIGLLCFILVAVQVLLIAFAMRGFAQGWNVEVEHPVDEHYDDRRAGGRRPQPA